MKGAAWPHPRTVPALAGSHGEQGWWLGEHQKPEHSSALLDTGFAEDGHD